MFEKQFALRRSSGGSGEEAPSLTPEEEEQIRRSRLTAAGSTSVKIAGLKISGRESYFNLLQQALWKNYTECRRTEPDLPELTEADVERRAVSMEYGIFSATKVITIYRRNMTLLTSQIKKATESFKLFDQLLEPEPPAPELEEAAARYPLNSGFIKASAMTIPPESVERPPSPPSPPAAEVSLLNKKRVSRYLTSNDDTSFVTPLTPKPAKTDEELIEKAKEIEKRLAEQLSLKTKSAAIHITEAEKKPVVPPKSVKSSKDKPTNSKTKERSSNSKPAQPKGSFKSSKRSLEGQTSLDRYFKRPRVEEAAGSKAADKSELKTKSPSPKKDKQATADLVVRCLMPHYKEKKIASRDLFKSLARHLAHTVAHLQGNSKIKL